jgi:hypothetical protein
VDLDDLRDLPGDRRLHRGSFPCRSQERNEEEGENDRPRRTHPNRIEPSAGSGLVM